MQELILLFLLCVSHIYLSLFLYHGESVFLPPGRWNLRASSACPCWSYTLLPERNHCQWCNLLIMMHFHATHLLHLDYLNDHWTTEHPSIHRQDLSPCVTDINKDHISCWLIRLGQVLLVDSIGQRRCCGVVQQPKYQPWRMLDRLDWCFFYTWEHWGQTSWPNQGARDALRRWSKKDRRSPRHSPDRCQRDYCKDDHDIAS